MKPQGNEHSLTGKTQTGNNIFFLINGLIIVIYRCSAIESMQNNPHLIYTFHYFS